MKYLNTKLRGESGDRGPSHDVECPFCSRKKRHIDSDAANNVQTEASIARFRRDHENTTDARTK